MYNISSGALAALKSDAPQGLSIQVDAIGGKLDLDESDFVGDITITRRCVSGDKIEIGTAIAAEFKATLQNYDGRFDDYTFEGAEMFVRFSVTAGETVEYIPIGYFTIDEPPRKLSTISITAFDRMARFNRPYDTATTYPASLYQLLSDACTKCGVTLATASGSLTNSEYSPPKQPDSDGLTYRKIVEWIAELTGTCAWIDWEGKLRLSWYTNTATRITPSDRFSSDMQENPIIITGVQITANDEGGTVYLAGSDTYALNIEGNLLAQDNLQSLCDGLDAKIGGFIYQPYTCATKGYPHLWPLDKITYEDKDGVAHASIITDHTIKLNGNSALAAKGETAQRNGYATSAPLTSKERAILERMKAQTNRKLSTMQQAALELNETMANSMGLYSTTTVNQDMSVTAYWHDKPTLEESQYIYTRNAGGYAWTDSGWNDGEPIWQYGVTKDGIAILNVLHVYKLTADYLDVRGLTVTNASGLETLKISPQGDVSLNVKSLSITGNQVATQGDINNLKIGSRNYLLNSEKTYTNQSREFLQTHDLAPIFDTYGMGTWTLSFDLKCAKAHWVKVYCQNGSDFRYDIGANTIQATTSFKRYSVTFIPYVYASNVQKSMLAFFSEYDSGAFVTVKNLKLEKGTKATDWTPAPEDRAYLVNTLSPTQADGMWLGSDGKLNITATQIKAGKLQSKDGKVFFDLDNGELRSNKLISKGNGTYMEITQGSSNNSLVGVVSPSGRTVLEASIDSSGNLGVSGNGFNWYASDMDLSIKSKVGGMSFGEYNNAEFGVYDEGGAMNTGLYFHRGISNKFDSAYFMINTSTYIAYHSGNIQCGYEKITPSYNSSLGLYVGSKTVSFSPAFAKSPIITVTPVTGGPFSCNASITDVTANSFKIQLQRVSSDATSVHWIAVEPE